MSEKPKQHHYTATYHEDGYVYLGTTCRTHVIIVTPHAKGLRVYSSHQFFARGSRGVEKLGRASKTCIVPGQYSLTQFVRWVESLAKTNNRDYKTVTFKNGTTVLTSTLKQRRRIRDIMRSSGMWDQRGRLAWKHCPKHFFRDVPLHTFMKSGSTRSYMSWYAQYLYYEFTRKSEYYNVQQRADAALRDAGKPVTPLSVGRQAAMLLMRKTKEDIQRKVFPRCPQRILGWGKVPLKYLVEQWMCGNTRRPAWKLFVRVVLKRFSFATLGKLQIDTLLWAKDQIFAPVIRFLANIDTDVDVALLIELFTHVPAEFAARMNLTARTDIEQMIATIRAYKAADEVHQNRRLTPEYCPPDLALPSGWGFADYTTLPEVLYANRIWTASDIEQGATDGRTHVIFRHETSRGDAMAVVTYDQEESAWRAERVEPAEINALARMTILGVVNTMNQRFPGPTNPAPQLYRDALLHKALESSFGKRLCKQYYAYNLERGYQANRHLKPIDIGVTHPAYEAPDDIIAHFRPLYRNAAQCSNQTGSPTVGWW